MAKDPEKQREAARRYRERNRDTIRAQDREKKKSYYQKNREAILAQKKEYDERNAQAIRDRKKSYREQNPDLIRAQKRISLQRHPEAAKARLIRWVERNPEKAKANWAKRRRLMREAEGSYSQNDVDQLYIQQNGTCLACMSPLGDVFEVDHVIPLSKGGSHYPSNLQLLCRSCNREKKDHDPIKFIQRKREAVA